MAAKAKKLHVSEHIEEREILVILKEEKLKIREVWKKLWKALLVAWRATDNVLAFLVAGQLVKTIETGKRVDAFHPKEELLKKTLIL